MTKNIRAPFGAASRRGDPVMIGGGKVRAGSGRPWEVLRPRAPAVQDRATDTTRAVAWLGAAVAAAMLGHAPGAEAQAPATAAPLSICIPPPTGQLADRTDVSAPLRQSVLASIGAEHIAAVPIDGREPADIDAEARAKACGYVLYSHVEHRHGSGIGGIMHKLAPLAGMLPVAGAGGGGGNGGLVTAVAQSALSAAASSQQPQAPAVGGAQQASVKAGDVMTLEYRLTAIGQTSALKTEKLQGKASSDGADVLGPLVKRLSDAVVGATSGQPSAAGATQAQVGPDTGQARRDDARDTSKTGRTLGGVFGGLFGGGSKDTARAPSGPAPGGMPSGMDCDQLAAMPVKTMSVESCRKMMDTQRAYSAAAADPSATRPGDDKMTCAEIMAEVKRQQYAAPDQAKLAGAQAAAGEYQSKLAQQQAEAGAIAARQQVALNAAIAADRAAEAQSAGLVRTRAAATLQQEQLRENIATGERMAREQSPQAQRFHDTNAQLVGDAGTQIAGNPRLARLIQLASAKNCSDH
jgi:hypothetical protein